MAASMWGNKIKDQCMKVRRFGSACHMKIVIHIQRRKLLKVRKTYNISTASITWDSHENDSLLSPQNVNRSDGGENTVQKSSYRLFPLSAHTFCTVNPHLVNNIANVGFQKRCYSSDGPEKRKLELMDFPQIVWPSPIKTIKNWILARLIIRPYFDRDFSLSEFAEGSKKAVEVVSQRLSEADFDGLEGLVTPNAVRELRSSVSQFSLQQRLELALSAEDMYFCFPHQVGIMFNDKDQRRYVEITMCYHVLRSLKELREQSINPPLNMGLLPEYQDKLFICNYRFLREYTRGVQDQWTINIANHFRPSDTLS